MSEVVDLSYIHPALQQFAIPISRCRLLRGNPRKGHRLSLHMSLAQFGQRLPFTGRTADDGMIEITVGNNRTEVARDDLGWTHVAVIVDDADAEIKARAWAATENRTADLATYDDILLREFLGEIASEDAVLFDATSFTLADLDVPPLEPPPLPPPTPRPTLARADLVFATLDQRDEFAEFLEKLATERTEGSDAERLLGWIRERR